MTLRRVVIGVVILVLAWVVVSVVLWSIGEEGPTRIGQGQSARAGPQTATVSVTIAIHERVVSPRRMYTT